MDDTVTINSELVELRKAKADKKAKRELEEKEKAARAEKRKQGEPQAFYSGLICFAQNRGWKEGWARHKFFDKYGKWPDGPGGMNLNNSPMTPRKAVKEFIAESARQWRKQQEEKADATEA